MSAQYIYTMKNVSRFYPPDRDILKDITLSFFPGAKIGVIGGNGAGKSSILKIMAGVDTEYTGEARLTPGFTVGYLEQEPHLDPALNVYDNVMEGVGPIRDLLTRYNEIMAMWGDPDADFDKIGALQAEIEDKMAAADAWNLERNVEIAMDALRCPPSDAEVTNLSGGEKRRVALCRLLLSHPDLLLLDEPTNHLDAESVAWLERFLADYSGTVIAITHDRYFLDNVAEWMLEVDHGRTYPYHGNYSGWLEQKQKRLALEEKKSSARQRILEKELEWVRSSPKARQAKGKARLQAYEELLAEAENDREAESKLEIMIPPGRRLGDLVIEADHISKAYEDKLLIDDFSFSLPRAGIVGVIGANGAGKTTLFRIITGNEEPDSGTLRIGPTVDLAYVDQSRAVLDDDRSVYEVITDGHDTIKLGNREVHGRSYCASFNFKGPDQQKKVGVLSGGERNRVHLARVLRTGGNVLLLDEPTNDLDVDTLRALEEALLNFPGCAVVISHDRWFLDRVATHILAFEGDSQLRWFEGNFTDYETFRKKELGDDSGPHRVKYKPMAR